MECPRCKNLMVSAHFEDLRDETGTLSFWAWRCITCGEVIDPIILTNRASHHRHVVKPRPRRKAPIALH